MYTQIIAFQNSTNSSSMSWILATLFNDFQSENQRYSNRYVTPKFLILWLVTSQGPKPLVLCLESSPECANGRVTLSNGN